MSNERPFTRAWQAETRHTLQYLSGRCLDLRNIIDPTYAYGLDLEPQRVGTELGRIIQELQRIKDYVDSKAEKQWKPCTEPNCPDCVHRLHLDG